MRGDALRLFRGESGLRELAGVLVQAVTRISCHELVRKAERAACEEGGRK